MFRYLHGIAYAFFPVLVPTPKHKLPHKPTPEEVLQERIQHVREDMLQLHMDRAVLRGRERQLEIMLNEYELSMKFYQSRGEQA